MVFRTVVDTLEATDDRLDGTYYHAVGKQTDLSPLRTSDGSHINPDSIDQVRWCALSRDLLNVPKFHKRDDYGKHWAGKYSYGDTIIVTTTDSTKGWYSDKIVGKWVVHDCMNARFSNMIDFLVSVDYLKGGKWRNLKVSKTETDLRSIPYNMETNKLVYDYPRINRSGLSASSR